MVVVGVRRLVWSERLMREIKRVFVVVWVGLVLFLLWGCQPKGKKKKEVFVPVEVGRVSRGVIRETLVFTGDIEGKAQVQVFSTIPAKILSMKVDEGDEVKKGQVLAVVKYTALAQRLAQAQAQLASVQSNMAGARVGLAGAIVGMNSARREYKRLKKLLKGGAVGKQNVDLAKVQYDGAVTKVQAARAQVRALAAQVRALRAGVAQARSARFDAMIKAPIDGIVAERKRQAGDMAMPQFPLMTVVQMDRLKVRIQLTERELSKVSLGKTTELTVAAHPGRRFFGVVKKIAPTLSLDTRTVAAEIHIPNLFPVKPERVCKTNADCKGIKLGACHKKRRRDRQGVCVERHPLKPAMIANVEILIKTYRNVTMIPEDAVLNASFNAKGTQKNLRLVLVVGKDNLPITRKIRVGIKSADGKLQVLSGLRVGERIIINGQNLYKPGVKIKIVREERAGGKEKKAPQETN